MIKHGKWYRLWAVLLVLCLLPGCAASDQTTQDAARYKVAVVAKSTQTDFWKAVLWERRLLQPNTTWN